VLDPRNHRREPKYHRGTRRTFHVIEYQQRYIWGAAAGMLMNLYEKLTSE
jgi:hypothetical protein